MTLRRGSVEETILLSSVSNGSEIELSDGHSLGSLDGGEAHLPLGASPRRVHSSSRQPGVATIEEGEEGPFSSSSAGSRAGSPREAMPRHKPLSLLPLVALIFYDVSGGPFGIEEGWEGSPCAPPRPALPAGRELATTFLEKSGYVAWVTAAAFGPFWGFQVRTKGFTAWVSGVIDNAVYPVLFLEYLQAVCRCWKASGPVCDAFLVGLNVALSYLNYRGLHVVGEAAIGMTIFMLLPFVALCLLGLPHVQPSRWLQVDLKSVSWMDFLNTLFCLNFKDTVSLVNCAYCLGQLLQFVAFIWLRIKYPTLHRPFRILLPTWTCALPFLPACSLLLLLVTEPWVVGRLGVIIFTVAVLSIRAVLHPLLQYARRHGLVGFHETTPHEFKEMLFSMYSPSDEDGPSSPTVAGSGNTTERQGLLTAGNGLLPSFSLR
ncbi:hypothetical protein ABPG75_012116 [Micractinium tetrahymenae]